MNKKRNALIFVSILMLGSMIFKSCTPEYYAVKKFRESTQVSVLFIPNQVVFKTNSTIQNLYPNFTELPQEIQDTIWNMNTQLLEKVPDSSIVETFYTSFLNLLKESDLRVYDSENMVGFNTNDTNAYILKIAQMEMDEMKQMIPYSQPIDSETELYKEVEINSLTLNVWFELTRAINDTAKPVVLYASYIISDVVKGNFYNTLSGYEFRFKRDDIDTTHILPMSVNAGEMMAQYFFNHILNMYAAYYRSPSDYQFRYIGNYILKGQGYSFYYPTENEQFTIIAKE
ncbi:MAG: hypothetical protein PHR79_05920 [Bacteroidales bacterium]|nr:hypothetical protein [Bacteroidales bacterium]